ncbi:DUF1853 family protein [Amphritea sp. 2_MG-2023]|jgi:hypothetical protein|uniref:DUF1853 family protein n=1 Tax=Amphritea TaxID=515417 RepID=UPI001C06D60C|nr:MULTISPECIES: DUF1853 family protein [Amphritea]MBU2966695.1 DUF1853 family protein [Amphritea atlantica]MDO6417446.1 DUF1853 family protein [Amphritea sp. 2_MG-2023]MDX2421976.1 DUF1853 family protein [Amphritea sp.]
MNLSLSCHPDHLSESDPLQSRLSYQHEIIRDLHWLIYSPSLMTLPDDQSSDWLFNQSAIHERLQKLDENPQPLINALRQQAKFRLGYYFEDLIRMYIQSFIQPIDLKCNIQVSRDKTTVGEYDFLMALKEGMKIHLEAAVKFYLCTSQDPENCALEDFIGPNRSDRLDKKWQRLTDHQMRLSHTDAGKDRATSLGLLPEKHSLLLRGYLFYPFAHWLDYHPPAPISADHLKGWWVRGADVESLGSEYQYVMLMKPRWLALALCGFQETLSCSELIERTDDITTPKLIARLQFDSNEGLWREMDRGFIVPDSWNLKR